MLCENKTGKKINTLTLMKKLTIWGTKEVFVIITLDIRGIIHEMQVETTPEMVSMIGHQKESKET